MALKQQQELKQQQRLSPQQIQTIRLLELPALEINERIKRELDENPALEEGTDYPDEHDADFGNEDNISENSDGNEDLSLGDYINEDDIPDYKLAEIRSNEERREDIPFSSGGESLHDYLLEQIELLDLNAEDTQICEYLVGNIDNSGYIRRSLREISDDIFTNLYLDISERKLSEILEIIRNLDPPGVGAYDLKDCLLIQLKRRKQSTSTELAIKILNDFFGDFSNKHYDKIQKELNISGYDIRLAIREITSLNPKPGANWDDSIDANANNITPDFIVGSNNGDIIMSLNSRGIPDLRINREYSDMFKDYTNNKANRTSEMRDAVVFVKQKLDAAQGFIDALKQRQETLQRTMETIIAMQRDFFLTGDESLLKPMILKDVAERTGYDISTVSRVSNSKYVQTDFGIFPLKFFFSEATKTESGEEISTRKIKQIIKQIIDEENKKKPITDDALTAVLKEKGFVIARRTVAKYREQLSIPVARMRRDV